MSEIITLLLMAAIPALLYLAIKSRMKKESKWKIYLIAAGGVFVILTVVTKM